MKQRVYMAVSLLVLTTTVLLLTDCKRTDRSQPSKSAVQLKRTSVPMRVFSIAGEVLAFEATGEAGRTQQLPVSLKQMQSRFGGFERVLVYEYNHEGKVLSQHEAKVGPNADVAIDASTGNRYLLYADLGGLFRNSYVVACSLGRARISGEVIPRICTQIFCGDHVFRASELKERIPELKSQAGLEELGDGLIGGFGGKGNICDQCLNGTFLPTRGCSDFVPLDPDAPDSPDLVVFTRNPTPNTVGTPDHQIYKMNADGTGEVNLSNNTLFERSPDVHHKTKKIVFNSIATGGGLTTMDLNGGNRTVIPNTFLGSNPKWSRNDESFIIYVRLQSNLNNALHRVRPDGSDNVEILTAGEGNVIRDADVVDDNYIVFSRDSGKSNSDIYIKDMRDNSDPVNLTNTSDRHESIPVISHDGQLIAYVSHSSTDFQGDEIHVARLNLPGSITVLHIIRLSAPAGRYLSNSSLDFSSDDKRVYVSSTVVETEGTSNTAQLFSIRLDGSGQFRLTLNEDSDLEPSVVSR